MTHVALHAQTAVSSKEIAKVLFQNSRPRLFSAKKKLANLLRSTTASAPPTTLRASALHGRPNARLRQSVGRRGGRCRCCGDRRR